MQMQLSPDSSGVGKVMLGGLSNSGPSTWSSQLQGGAPSKTVLFGKHSEDMSQSLANSQSSADPLSFKPKAGPRLRAEGVMAPPASDAGTLRRQVAALQMDLETHIDGEARLQSINQQLRESLQSTLGQSKGRLELYMKQNHENVERAENELNTLHEDMEQTLELQRRLAQRASLLEKEKKEMEEALQKRSQEFQAERSSLQSRIENLSEDLSSKQDAQIRAKVLQAELEAALAAKQKLEEQLRDNSNEAENLRRKADEYNNELSNLIAKEQRNRLLESRGKRVQLRKCFQWFQESIKEKCLHAANQDVAIGFAKYNCLRRGIRALRLATMRAIHMRVSESRRAQSCLQECWRAWRLSTVAKRRYEGALEQRKQSCKCKMMFNWKKAVEYGKLSEVEEKSLTVAASKHWGNTLCRRVLSYWLQWVLYWARPKQWKLKNLQVRLDRLTCKQALSAWQSLVRMKRCKRLKMEQADLQRQLWLQRRALNRWKNCATINKIKRILNSKGLAFWKLHQYQAVIYTWRDFMQIKKNQKCSKSLAFRHYLHILKSKGIATWRKNIRYQQAEAKAIHQVNQALARAALSLWQDYHAANAIKKRKELNALVNCKRKERKISRSVFMFWWEEASARKLSMRLGNMLASQRLHTKIRTSLSTWLHATFGHVLVANVKLQNDLLDAKAQYEDQKDQTNAIDVENLQLIDRLHALSSEIAVLKLAIAEKAKQEEDLHRALEDGALIESSMQGELDQQRAHVQELQQEVLKLQRKLQKKNIEDTEGEVHHTMATQKLQRALKDLQRQLADKSLQMDAYEKALKETAEKLEGASDESHEKLSSAFEIAASLRKILEDRETQFVALEGNCRRKELELGEIQKKLHVAHSKFTETVEARDSRIHELENLLAQKQAEVQESQLELQEMKLSLSNRDSLVRKLEYEIKLKAERESHMARTFISGLNSLSSPRGEVTFLSRSNFPLPQSHEAIRHSKSVVQQRGLEEAVFPPRSPVDNVQLNAPFAFLTKPESQDDTHSSHSRSSKQAERGASDASRGLDEGSSSPTTSSSSAQEGSHENADDDRAPSFSTRTDWETSFALVSTTRPIPAGVTQESSPRFITEVNLDECAELQPSNRLVVDDDPGAVNGLHAEIQRLQARIMNRLRESPEERSSRSEQRGSLHSHSSSARQSTGA